MLADALPLTFVILEGSTVDFLVMSSSTVFQSFDMLLSTILSDVIFSLTGGFIAKPTGTVTGWMIASQDFKASKHVEETLKREKYVGFSVKQEW